MSYRRSSNVPGKPEALLGYVLQELEQVERAISGQQTHMWLQSLAVEPDKPRDGMIVLADGTNWDPGSGAGYYGYRSGSWRYLE